ncbi:LysR substrate-binding domain-containing protein [Parasediminibacterium sp. JCM 36343]|uniref:hydrogen peroxide-inducible genes activator n=1 Tax=Parasediminibacterium sp. JCM 36343 TaxID=3374279 RepID=UPI00397E54DF
MTLVQLEYIVAVDTYRHFAKAAEHCFVTQPSLSAQIQKLEEELGVKIFDRTKQPVLPTEPGLQLIEQARKIIAECASFTEMVDSKKNILTGELKIGVIPTLAPYLLPLFIQAFAAKFPLVRLVVNELTTDILIARLREGRIDVGLLVTPLNEKGIQEDVLFYEEMVAYISNKNEAYKKNYVLATDIDPEKLWLLEEGHCFRSQIINLCELRKSSKEGSHFEYEAGSLETLRRMVEVNDGITILPELATTDLSTEQQKSIRHFQAPAPVREVSIITHRDFAKRRLVEALRTAIIASIPEKVKNNTKGNIIPI